MQIINLTKDYYSWRSTQDTLIKGMRDWHYNHIIGYRPDQMTGQYEAPKLCGIEKGITSCVSENNRDLLFSILEQIPIFLVDKSLCGRSYRMGFLGHALDITVPFDQYYGASRDVEDLYKDLENGICEVGPNEDEASPRLDLPFVDRSRNQEPKTHYYFFDLLGVYLRRYPAIRDYDMTESHPQIFIWVDKISAIVGDNYSYFKALLTQVVAHELMHAFMDIDLLGCIHSRSFKIKSSFYTLKEECLANALSLMLVKPYFNYDQWDFVTNFVAMQPFAYKLGLDYFELGERVVETALQSWMEIKEFGEADKEVLKYWLHYLYENKTHDAQQLVLYEEGLINPNYVYRYQSIMYSYEALVVRVIKDFSKVNQGNVSRQNMKDAFPDSLNEDYNVFIDYPESNLFIDKRNNVNRPIQEYHLLACKDGKLAVCDSWDPDSMPAFVANAKKLGFEIEMFGW